VRWRSWILVSMLAGGGELVTAGLVAQSYGLGDQVLTIGVSGFKGVQGAQASIDADGYLYNSVPGAFSYYLAPLPLPEGALIEQICLYANDSDTGAFQYAQAYLTATKLVPGGESPATLQIPGASVQSSSDIGYGYYCTDPLSYTLRGRLDVDGDGNLDAAVHYLTLYLPAASQNALGFGGVRITWKRQVTPPPGTPTFADVPPSDPAFQYIEALVASGITAGCGDGTTYCPDANLTRRQMAVFLAKALGLHWTD
jgi:S-layer family protein